MKHDIIAPKLNPNDDEVRINRWYVTAGAAVEAGQAIGEVESSKVLFELECPVAGYLMIHVNAGEQACVGLTIATVFAEPFEKPSAVNGSTGPRFSKAAATYLEQHDVEMTRFNHKDLWTLEDVIGTLSHEESPTPGWPAGQVGVYAVKEDQTSGKRFDTVAITSSMTVVFPSLKLRQELGRFGIRWPLALLLYELARLLPRHPRLNACFSDRTTTFHKAIHIGLVLDLGYGPRVAVIRHADACSPMELWEQINTLSTACLKKKLTWEQMQGATILVSDLSDEDVYQFQPMLIQNCSAILGIGGDRQQPGHPMTLNLVFDTRLLSGREVGTFLGKLKKQILDSSFCQSLSEPGTGPIPVPQRGEANDWLNRLQILVAKILNMNDNPDVDLPLRHLLTHSLHMIHLKVGLEVEHGVFLPMEVLGRCASLRELATRLAVPDPLLPTPAVRDASSDLPTMASLFMAQELELDDLSEEQLNALYDELQAEQGGPQARDAEGNQTKRADL